jgi:hypothetical protein
VTGPQPTSTSRLTPLSRRLLQVAGVLSALLVLVLVNAFLHEDGAEEPLEYNLVAAAAQRTQSQPGARFTMTAVYTTAALPGKAVAHGRGAYNSETGLSEASLELSSPTEGRITVDSIADSTSIYLSGNKISAELPGGKTWMKMEPLLGHSQEEAMLGGGDADGSLGILSSASGQAALVGREKVRGVATRRYRAEVSLDDYADLLREEGKDDLADQYDSYGAMIATAPVVEGWIDGKKILRRMRMVMTMPTAPGQPSLTMDVQMDLFDFGAQPQIALPDSDQVFDATPILREQLDAASES